MTGFDDVDVEFKYEADFNMAISAMLAEKSRRLSPAYGNPKRKRSYVAKAAKAGADVVQKSIKGRVPVDTGELRDGLIPHKERSRTPEKVVYDIMPDPKKNDIFQKPIMNRNRSERPHAYYPASQEYGFYTRRPDGGMVYYRPVTKETMYSEKVPGKYYMLGGAVAAAANASKIMIKTIVDGITQEWEIGNDR